MFAAIIFYGLPVSVKGVCKYNCKVCTHNSNIQSKCKYLLLVLDDNTTSLLVTVICPKFRCQVKDWLQRNEAFKRHCCEPAEHFLPRAQHHPPGPVYCATDTESRSAGPWSHHNPSPSPIHSPTHWFCSSCPLNVFDRAYLGGRQGKIALIGLNGTESPATLRHVCRRREGRVGSHQSLQ